MTKLAIYGAVALPFALLDFIWLTLMGDRLYRPVLGDMMRINVWPAVLFYLVYPIGVVMFAVLPAKDPGSARAPMLGMMFGFFTYATYDLTNQATLQNWSTLLTSVDVVWGSALADTCAYLGYLIAVKLDA
jgi:uncharacterized membrane protein